jgi:anti-anti-sigma regulatory factor
MLMTCRIDRLVSDGEVAVVRISGRLTAHDVELLRTVLEQEASSVKLDLSDLLFVDRTAVRLLAVAEARGIQLINCSPYIREWVAREPCKERRDVEN